MSARRPGPLLTLLAVIVSVWGCHSEICAIDNTLVPRGGVDLQGRMVCLGRSADEVERQLGQGEVRQDLGVVGVRVLYPGLALALLYAGPGTSDPLRAITLLEGARATTEAGLGIGSAEADARAELGAPAVDPALGAWFYDEAGLALQWQDRRLIWIQLFARPEAAP